MTPIYRVMFGPRGYEDFKTREEANEFAVEKRKLKIARDWGIVVVKLTGVE